MLKNNILVLTLVLTAVIGAFLIMCGFVLLGCFIAWVLDHFGFLEDDVYIEINKGQK